MNLSFFFRKLQKLVVRNYFISILALIALFVIVVASIKILFTPQDYVYARVKIGQGLWWAATAKPPIWFVSSLKKGLVQKDLTGSVLAEIMSVKYYPAYSSNQYDVYVTLRLAATKTKRTGAYDFNRSSIGVGSPIDLEFPETQFSGTVIRLSTKPIVDQYIQKTIYLTKKTAAPWEYEAIKVGDKYFDGGQVVFEVMEKRALNTSSEASDAYGNYPAATEMTKYIEIKAKIKVGKVGEQLIYGEEQIVTPGNILNLMVDNYRLTDYLISEVE